MSRCLFLLLMAMLVCGCKGEDPRRHFEKEGGFSYVPPEGWALQAPTGKIADDKGRQFHSAVEPRPAGSAAVLAVFEDRAVPGTVSDYVRQQRSMLERSYGWRVLKEDVFTAESGLQGMRLTVQDPASGIRQTFYFFPKGQAKIVVNCVAPAGRHEELAAVFEAALKTMRFDP